ncbi:hypothetical protein [Shewanella canadensis]|uniref:hypothetical protein n=1 Tax=Shewanella canadensis TaxID=271096 RepID=UPI001FE9FFCB|nr:hypothetical protein [Shewanella canadensis]
MPDDVPADDLLEVALLDDNEVDAVLLDAAVFEDSATAEESDECVADITGFEVLSRDKMDPKA